MRLQATICSSVLVATLLCGTSAFTFRPLAARSHAVSADDDYRTPRLQLSQVRNPLVASSMAVGRRKRGRRPSGLLRGYDDEAAAAVESALFHVVESACASLEKKGMGEGRAAPNSLPLLLRHAAALLRRLAEDAIVRLGEGDEAMADNDAVETSACPRLEATRGAIQAASALRAVASFHGPSKGKGRKALRGASSVLLRCDGVGTTAADRAVSAIGVLLVGAALAVDIRADEDGDGGGDDHAQARRPFSRAAASGVIPDGGIADGTSAAAADGFILALLGVAIQEYHRADEGVSVAVDLHIIALLSRVFGVAAGDDPAAKALSEATSVVLRRSLPHPGGDASIGRTGDGDVGGIEEAKAALALTAQLSPWSSISPVPVTEAAIDLDLWHAAERICDSVIRKCRNEAPAVVQTLVDSASDRHQYRRADALATKYYHEGGKSRYVEARLRHAESTISKVMKRRQLSLIERQVDRVDRAVDRVQTDGGDDSDGDEIDSRDGLKAADVKEEVRNFALRRLQEADEHDKARRLAGIWSMEFSCSAEDMARIEKVRRERYLQWEESLPGTTSAVPDVVSTPDALTTAFAALNSTGAGFFGFDVEWGDEDCIGAALLQLATTSSVILVDVPALSKDSAGATALELTVGHLFAGTRPCVGFHCKEDLVRLRRSPCARKRHWLGATCAVLDVKPLIAEKVPKLKHLGLSRVCEHFLGKLLDKAEQCSLWTARPLSLEQRVYAALDAWVCAAIYEKMSSARRNAC